MTITESDWQPPADAIPWIVCAACKSITYHEIILVGPRHFDTVMLAQLDTLKIAYEHMDDQWNWEQGFIDQWGRFYNRIDAMAVVRNNNQPFNRERNGGSLDELFSGGLY